MLKRSNCRIAYESVCKVLVEKNDASMSWNILIIENILLLTEIINLSEHIEGLEVRLKKHRSKRSKFGKYSFLKMRMLTGSKMQSPLSIKPNWK